MPGAATLATFIVAKQKNKSISIPGTSAGANSGQDFSIASNTPLPNVLIQASTQVNGGADSDNRCLGAYTGRARVHEADPGPSIINLPNGSTIRLTEVEPAREAYGDGRCPGVQGAAPPDYLEPVDNVSFEAKSGICNWLEATCGRGKGYFIVAECPDGHRHAKELVCNKDWCSVCGKKHSIAHMRRFARWLPKVMQFKSMGYLVFTLPQELESKYRVKKDLAGLGHQVQELLKGLGFARGLRRWHWFGEKSTRWRPHLNVLVDGGFISQEIIAAIKAGYASILGVNLADVNYRYRPTPGKMVHTLGYVTRATFLDDEWDLEMALELHGFRNMVVWGRGLWDLKPAWSKDQLHGKARSEVEGLDLAAIEALVEKRCPVCGQLVLWGEALPIALLDKVDSKPLGAGYHRLSDLSPPRGCRMLLRRSSIGWG